MSAAPQAPSNPVPPPPSGPPAPNEITVISHCSLFYWWPVWAVGFIMAILTYIDGYRMAVVPKPGKPDQGGTEVLINVEGKLSETGTDNPRDYNYDKKTPVDVLVMPKGSIVPGKDPIKLHTSRSKNYGVLFATVLLLVIVITNVPLRGGWSFAIIVFAILIVIILALADVWDRILENLSYLDIRINAGGYVFISGILLGIWLITILVFDRRIYMTFTAGQFKVCTEIGGGEKVYPSEGMALEKQRSDLFRHWILGLGSGDLVVKTTGAQMHEFDLHNVLFIGKKVKQIEEMLKKRVVVASR
jgi:hypothetical protein